MKNRNVVRNRRPLPSTLQNALRDGYRLNRAESDERVRYNHGVERPHRESSVHTDLHTDSDVNTPRSVERRYDQMARDAIAREYRKSDSIDNQVFANDYRHDQIRNIAREIKRLDSILTELKDSSTIPQWVRLKAAYDTRFRDLFRQQRYGYSDSPTDDNVALSRSIEAACATVKDEVLRSIPEEIKALEQEASALSSQLAELHARNQYKKKRRVRTASAKLHAAAEATARGIESGALRIQELAIQQNAIVVHALPLPEWAMNRTAGNNTVIDSHATDTETKISIIESARPDLSASILSTAQPIQGLMYPLGVIVDGFAVASYSRDALTHTAGSARVTAGETLQDDPVRHFASVASTPTNDGSTQIDWNECIVYMPQIKGFLIDEAMRPERLKHFNIGSEEHLTATDTREELSSKEEEMREKHAGAIDLSVFTTTSYDPSRGYGKTYVVAQWNQDALAIARNYVHTHFPHAALYFRRYDGIYDAEGMKVTPAEIYHSKQESVTQPTPTNP